MSNRATDTRPPFFIIEDAVLDYALNPYEGWLYIAIVKHASRKTGEAFPSIKTLAQITGMSKASVIRAIKSLETKGLIRVTRDENTPGKDREVNHYWVLQATPPVSDSNRGGITKQPPPVSVVDTNQSHLEPEKESAPNGAGASQPKPRKREPFYDAIADVWQTDASGIIVTIRSIMQGTATRRTIKDCNFTPPVTDVEEIYAFRSFMRARMAEKKMAAPPSAYTTIQAWFYDFRKGREQRATNGYIPPEQRTSPLDFIRWADGCEPEWAKDKGAE